MYPQVGQTASPFDPIDIGVPVPISPRYELGPTEDPAERDGRWTVPTIAPPHPRHAGPPAPTVTNLHSEAAAHRPTHTVFSGETLSNSGFTNSYAYPLSSHNETARKEKRTIHPSMITRAARIIRQAFPDRDLDITTLVQLYMDYSEGKTHRDWDSTFLTFTTAYVSLQDHHKRAA